MKSSHIHVFLHIYDFYIFMISTCFLFLHIHDLYILVVLLLLNTTLSFSEGFLSAPEMDAF